MASKSERKNNNKKQNKTKTNQTNKKQIENEEVKLSLFADNMIHMSSINIYTLPNVK